jgi:hypothetical protein
MTTNEFKQRLAEKAGIVPVVPVGRSIEAHGSSSGHAIRNAIGKANARGLNIGQVLHCAQIEAGKYEVVFQDMDEEGIPDGQ